MSPGRTASGNSSGGGKRSKSGEFPSIVEPEAKAGPAANKPASIAPNAPEVDAGWEASDPVQHNAKSDDKTTVRNEVIRPQAPTARARVSQTSIGTSRKTAATVPKAPSDRPTAPPPRSPAAKVEVALLNERMNVPKGISGDKSSGRARSPSSPGGDTTSAGPQVLNQWLSEGSENNFHPSQIAHLVIDVMGIETPVASAKETPVASAIELNTSKSESDASISKSESEAIAAASVEPPRSLPPVTTDDDGWDVSPQDSVRTRESQGLIRLPAKSSKSESAAAVQKIVPAESRGRISVRPSSAPAATGQKAVAAENRGRISVRPSSSAPAATDQKTVPVESRGRISVRPSSAPAATGQKTVAAENRGKISVKPASKSAPISDKPRATPAAKKAAVVERRTHHARSEGLDSEWAREFFASNATDSTPVDEYHEPDEDIDERHLRSISPEATARRARYRVIVIGLIVAMTLLLAVAVALKLLHKH